MFTSTGLIGVAILLAFVGTIIAALYAMFALGLAGAPGALLSEAISRKGEEPKIPLIGLLVTFIGQLYVSLAFVVFIVLSVRSVVGGTTGIGKWLLWLVAFYVSLAPVWMALKDATRKRQEGYPEMSIGKIVPHYAMAFTAPLTGVGFFLFALFPSLTWWGWGWIPHF
jgi:hypothetical protein